MTRSQWASAIDCVTKATGWAAIGQGVAYIAIDAATLPPSTEGHPNGGFTR